MENASAKEVSKRKEILSFKAGRDNTMVTNLRTHIGDTYGNYVVVANAAKRVKPDRQYKVELIEMKSGKGFIVTSAIEVRDELKLVIDGDCVSVFIKEFGDTNFESEPSFIYNRTGCETIDNVAEKIAKAKYAGFGIRCSATELLELIDDFKAKCNMLRSGSMDGVILDEPLCRLEDENVNVYLRRSYEGSFPHAPIAVYDAREMGWQGIVDELGAMFASGSIIMPKGDYDAFIAGFKDLCRKREREHVKEVKSNFKKDAAFTKSIKIVDGEKIITEL